MEIGARGTGVAGVERRAGPSAAVAELTAAAEPETKPEPAAAHAPWIKPLSDYERREGHEFACSRYG
jgi:hypothetical protein